MTTTKATERPIRAAVFDTIEQADHAVAELLKAGFTKEHVTVICSNKAIERHFAEFDHEDPAGAHTPAATILGGTIGATLGGFTVLGSMALVAGTAATGGGLLLATAGAAAWAGGVFGGLVGAMMTRGIEKEPANFYDQAVADGKILVAADVVNDSDPDAERRQLAEAAASLERAGASSVPLREG